MKLLIAILIASSCFAAIAPMPMVSNDLVPIQLKSVTKNGQDKNNWMIQFKYLKQLNNGKPLVKIGDTMNGINKNGKFSIKIIGIRTIGKMKIGPNKTAPKIYYEVDIKYSGTKIKNIILTLKQGVPNATIRTKK